MALNSKANEHSSATLGTLELKLALIWFSRMLSVEELGGLSKDPPCNRSTRTRGFGVQGRWKSALGGMTQIRLLIHSAVAAGHLAVVEPLSVAVWADTIQRARSDFSAATALDIGANVGAYSLLAARLGATVTAVDMQPRCAFLTRCNLQLNELLGQVQVIGGFIAPEGGPESLEVPLKGCGTMVSPSAVAGRKPYGESLRGNFDHEDRVWRAGQTRVRRLSVGELVRGPISVVKIDTEGHEPLVLESLRSAWPLLGDVIMELQPAAWRYSNVTVDGGLATLRDFILRGSYTVISLPHSRGIADRNAQALPPDLCELSAHSSRPVASQGIDQARIHDWPEFEAYARGVSKHGGFSEFWLTKRRCMSA